MVTADDSSIASLCDNQHRGEPVHELGIQVTQRELTRDDGNKK